MTELLTWVKQLPWGEAIALSLIVNAIVFAITLVLGALIARLAKARPVALPAPPLTATEVLLAAACVVLNSLVMLAGWWLFTLDIVRVDADPRWWRWLVDAAVLTVAMDLLMYITHRMAHHPIAFTYVHGLHHRYDQPRALTLFVLHPIEVLGFGGLWIIVLCTHPFSLGGMLLYLTLNTTFGVLGHIGYEPLPKSFMQLPVVRVIGTSTFHARHHQEPTSNYGFYTGVWDQLFRTLNPRYRAGFGELPPE